MKLEMLAAYSSLMSLTVEMLSTQKVELTPF